MSKPVAILSPEEVIARAGLTRRYAREVLALLDAEARRQKFSGREVPILVFPPDEQPYFCVAEDEDQQPGKAGGA